MSRFASHALLVVLAVAGCGKRERQHRTGDAALVERITAPVLVDGATPKGSADELEPNDTDDTAMELAVGHAVHGRVDPLDTDVDSYRIEVAAAGVLALELTSVKDTDLWLELHDAGGSVIARSDRTGESKEGIPNFGVAKGRYTAVVRGRKVMRGKVAVKPPSPALPYDLAAQLVTPPANAEHEPDDDRGTANDLIAGDPVSGYIGWTGDADVWKLSLDTLSGNNVLDIELAPLENTSLVLELADAMGQPVLTRKGPRGQGLSIRGLKPNLPAGAPPYEYVTIKASPSNPESPYSLKATARNPDSTDAEIEPNDSADKPMMIPAERTVVQAQWSPGDIDCFAVAPEANPRGLEIKIETPPTADLGVELLVDGKVVAKADTKGKGVAETVKGPVPANAKVVIRVHGADGGTEGNYELKVVEGPFKMKVRGSTNILVLLALTNLVAYAARNALFAVYPDLIARYGIDDEQIGLLQTVFMVPHAAATLGFGWAGDRYDRRRVIAVGMVIASIAGAAGAIGESYLGLAASRALVGFGTAAVVPVANSILSQIFEGPSKASRLAVFNLGLFVGGVVGFAVGAGLGFPLVLIALAVPGIALSFIVLLLPVPPHAPLPPQAFVHPHGAGDLGAMVKTFFADARELLKIQTLRWVIASTTVMAFAAGGFNAWLKELLVRDKHMSEEAATSLLGLALCGGLSGIIVGARIADRLRARLVAGRLWTIVIGMTLTAPCAALALVAPAGIGLDAIGVATLFFISWYHAPMAASVDDLAPPRLAVAAQGLVIFTMHMFGTAPSSWIVGAISKRSDLPTALWVPTGALVVAAGCMAIATRSFGADRARARPASTDGASTGASL